eukprot:sb/3469083/
MLIFGLVACSTLVATYTIHILALYLTDPVNMNTLHQPDQDQTPEPDFGDLNPVDQEGDGDPGLGIAIGLQNIITTRLFELCKMDRLNMIRIVTFLGFASTFVLAFAEDNYLLITGTVLGNFPVPPVSPGLFIVLIGTTIGMMAATQAIAEGVFLSVVIVAYKETHPFMNGACYFIVTFFLGGALVIALFYRHPKGFDHLAPGSSPSPEPGSKPDLTAVPATGVEGSSNEGLAVHQETAA